MRKLSLANKKIYLFLQEQAKKMRYDPTEAEKILWEELKHFDKDNKFRRQHIIDKFIVDFCCVNKKLIIEVDGKIHEQQPGRDKEREQILKNHEFSVLRFSNDEVINNLETVMNKILTFLKN